MFSTLKTEVAARFAEIQGFVAVAADSDGVEVIPATPTTRIVKGLSFVLIYAIYEYTVNQALQITWRELTNARIPIRDVRWPLLSVALNSEFQSLSDAKDENGRWKRRHKLLERARSVGDLVVVPDALFPADGNHYRAGQLETIWQILGITSPIVPAPPLRGRIQEVVENRNAISHGRMTAEQVGARLSLAEVRVRIRDIENVCSYIVAILENHCADQANFR